jgi:tight adherence protein B
VRRLSGALTLGLAFAALLAGPGHAADGPKLTPIGKLSFPERGYLVDFPGKVAVAAHDVRVWENGRRIQHPSFVPARTSTQRFGIVLVIDASNSMRGPALRDAFGAARAFVLELGPGERIGLVTFNSRSRVVVAPEQERAAMTRALSRVPATSGGTRINDAVGRAIDLLRAQGVASGSVVLLSDGADTGSKTRIPELAARAREAHVRIFTIGLHSHSFESGSLRRLAEASRGAYSPATSSRQLQAIYRRIGSQLAGEYVLRYRSPARTGELVKLFLEVNGQGSSLVSYAAPRPADGVRPSLLNRFWSSSWSFAVVALVAASLLFGALLGLLRGGRSSLRERIAHFVTPDGTAQEGERRTVVSALVARTERSLERTRWWERFREELEIAEITVSPALIVLGSIGGTLVAALVLALVTPVFSVFAFAVPLGVRRVCRRRLCKVRDEFGEQLPETLQVLASALRAGHSFVGGLSVVVAASEGPMLREFRRVVADEQLGIPLEDSLRQVARRMDNADLEQIALVAELQRRTGGNMAEVLDRVVETVRGRFDLRRLVRTLTAQGRMARWIMTALPVILFAAVSVLNPGYEATLYESTGGQIALAVAALMVVAGSLAIKKIVEIKV